jgi:hypothetical protein
VKPNKADLKEWEELCTFLEGVKGKATHFVNWRQKIPNEHLLSQEPLMRGMRKWMKENGYELVFYSSGWGWRLRKDWKEKLEWLKATLE